MKTKIVVTVLLVLIIVLQPAASQVAKVAKIVKNPRRQARISFAKQIQFAWHNFYRSYHGAKALVPNATLDTSAQALANQLISLTNWTSSFTRNLAGNGTNIFAIYDSENAFRQYTSSEATKTWYNDGFSRYNFNKPNFNNSLLNDPIRPFTQLLWKKSTSAGIGFAVNKNRLAIVVQYSPAGNIAGKYKGNVANRVESPQFF